jgi:hypothetical protein
MHVSEKIIRTCNEEGVFATSQHDAVRMMLPDADPAPLQHAIGERGQVEIPYTLRLATSLRSEKNKGERERYQLCVLHEKFCAASFFN